MDLSTPAGRRVRGGVLVLSLGLALTTGCTPAASSAGAPSAGATAPATPAPSPSPPPAGPPDAATVRAGGLDLGVVGLTLTTPPAPPSDDGAAVTPAPPPTTTADAEGAAGVVVPLAAPLGPETTAAYVAAPDGGSFEVLTDGSALVRDGAGTAVAGFAPPRTTAGPDLSPAGVPTRFVVVAPDLLAVVATGPGADPAVVLAVGLRVSAAALAGTDWGEREGGRSLAVVPTAWARAAGQAGTELLRAQLTAAEPEAGTATMHAQLECHAIGAPDKDSWNLEPWRPDVGLLPTMAAGCNPT